MGVRWYLELVEVAAGDRVHSHAIGERIWLDESTRVVMGREPSADVYCLGQGQGGRRTLNVEVRGGALHLQHLGHQLPIWHRGRPVREAVTLAEGDRFGPAYGIVFVVGRADPGPVPGAHRVGPAVAFAPRGRGSGSAPRVSSGFRVDDPARTIVDVLWWPGPSVADHVASLRARMESHTDHATNPRILDVGAGAADAGEVHGVWALRESTLGVSLPALWRRTEEQRASLDVDSAGFIVESLARGALLGVLDGQSLTTASAVLRFDDGQPLLLHRTGGAALDDDVLLPRLDEEGQPSLVVEAAALLARCLQPGRSGGRSYAWTPPTQARADVRAAFAATTELADEVRILAVAAAGDDPLARPSIDALLASILATRTSSTENIRRHVRDVLGHLFPAEHAAAEEMREAVGVLAVE